MCALVLGDEAQVTSRVLPGAPCVHRAASTGAPRDRRRAEPAERHARGTATARDGPRDRATCGDLRCRLQEPASLCVALLVQLEQLLVTLNPTYRPRVGRRDLQGTPEAARFGRSSIGHHDARVIDPGSVRRQCRGTRREMKFCEVTQVATVERRVTHRMERFAPAGSTRRRRSREARKRRGVFSKLGSDRSLRACGAGIALRPRGTRGALRAHGPVRPASPIGPVDPIGPIEPVKPIGPGVPCGPAGPVAPGGPTGPSGPVAPVGPEAPVSPGGPSSPFGPGLLPDIGRANSSGQSSHDGRN